MAQKTPTDLAFSLNHVSKRFGQVQANENVTLEVKKGEIHALLGENGSGKSTLMNILSGIYQPDSGSIFIHQQQKIFKTPKDAIDAGIGMIHQHFKLAEPLTAGENIVAGTKGKLPPKAKLYDSIQKFSQQYDMEINPARLTSEMSVSEKQTVEILKVLYRGANILILDEPTAVLTPQEIDRFFTVLKNMAKKGCSIVFISHKMNEVRSLCDQVTVLRKGQSVFTAPMKDTTTGLLIEKMVGHKINLSIDRPLPNPSGEECLKVDNLSIRNPEGALKLSNIHFSIQHGEILGVAGLAGSGQKELCEALAGIITPESGNIFFQKQNIAKKSPRDIIQMGISMSFIPEDRLGMGLVASMDIVDNILLKDYDRSKGPWLKKNQVKKKSLRIVKDLDIKTPGIYHPVRQLSGGNIQKVILGREIDLQPKLLITAYAVRGLDIHSSYTIYNLLNQQKKKNVAILYIGEDLDVLLELCDRIMVLCAGEITGIVDARTTTKEMLGQLMSGISEPQTGGAND